MESVFVDFETVCNYIIKHFTAKISGMPDLALSCKVKQANRWFTNLVSRAYAIKSIQKYIYIF